MFDLRYLDQLDMTKMPVGNTGKIKNSYQLLRVSRNNFENNLIESFLEFCFDFMIGWK